MISIYIYVHMLETNFNHINLYFRLRKNLFPRFMLMNLHCVSSVLIIFLSNLSVTHTMKRSCQFDGGCEAKKPFLSWRNWDIEPVSNARNVSFGFNPSICQKEIPKFAGVLLVNTSGESQRILENQLYVFLPEELHLQRLNKHFKREEVDSIQK